MQTYASPHHPLTVFEKLRLKGLLFTLIFATSCSFQMSGGEFQNTTPRRSTSSSGSSTPEEGAPAPGAIPSAGESGVEESEAPASSEPEVGPSSAASSEPAVDPSSEPSSEPTSVASTEPAAEPSGAPSSEPSAEPTSVASTEPADSGSDDGMSAEERAAYEAMMEALRTTPPTTTVSLASGVYTGTQTLTLQCTSIAGASACASLMYELSHSGGTPASAEVILDPSPSVNLTLDRSGTYTLRVHSVDTQGNIEADQSFTYELDLEDPVLSLSRGGAPVISGSTDHATYDITVGCTDVTSRCDSFAYTLDGTEPDYTGASASTRTGVPGTDTIHIGETTGTYTLKVRGRDSAGRVGATQEYRLTLQLPCSSPTISSSGYETTGACTRRCGSQPFELPVTQADRTECVCQATHSWLEIRGSREVGMCKPSARVHWMITL